MSNEVIFDLESKLKKDLKESDIQSLTNQARLAGQIHDTIIPMVNEVVTSVGNATSYEDAYKLLIDKLRAMHETIVNTKIVAEQTLLKNMGRAEVNREVLEVLSPVIDGIREKIKQDRVETIANQIQSGTLNPDTPRKIGSRPEKIQNIREAKRTLFGEPNSNDDKG